MINTDETYRRKIQGFQIFYSGRHQEEMVLLAILFLVFATNECISVPDEKRLVLHSDVDLDVVFKGLQAQIDLLNRTLTTEYEQKIQRLETELRNVGSTYVRWGRTSCDGQGTQKVYSGFAAGSPFELKGSSVNYICLPEHPTWAKYVDGFDSRGGEIIGAEYELSNAMSNTAFAKNLHDEDVPCAVCKSPRPTTLMIPAQTTCYSGWTMEYTGYLMSGWTGHEAATEYVCVDSHPEVLYHGEANTNGKLFYFVEAHCGGLPCQVYPEGRELTCVVCSQ